MKSDAFAERDQPEQGNTEERQCSRLGHGGRRVYRRAAKVQGVTLVGDVAFNEDLLVVLAARQVRQFDDVFEIEITGERSGSSEKSARVSQGSVKHMKMPLRLASSNKLPKSTARPWVSSPSPLLRFTRIWRSSKGGASLEVDGDWVSSSSAGCISSVGCGAALEDGAARTAA